MAQLQNYAQYGGAIDALGSGNNEGLWVKNAVVDKNEAIWRGGGISIREGKGTIQVSEFNGNYAEQFGGAVYADNDSEIAD